MAISSVEILPGDLMAAIAAKVSIRNPTASRVRLLADTLNVQAFTTQLVPGSNMSDTEYNKYLGLYYGLSPHGQPPPWTASQKSEALQDTPISRYELNLDVPSPQRPGFSPSPFIYSIVPFRTERGWVLDPGEEDTRSAVFYVPARSFDYLRLTLASYSGRDSEVLNSVSVRYDQRATGDIYVKGSIARISGHIDLGDISLVQATDYGLSYNESVFELPLWEARSMPPTQPASKP